MLNYCISTAGAWSRAGDLYPYMEPAVAGMKICLGVSADE